MGNLRRFGTSSGYIYKSNANHRPVNWGLFVPHYRGLDCQYDYRPLWKSQIQKNINTVGYQMVLTPLPSFGTINIVQSVVPNFLISYYNYRKGEGNYANYN